MSRVGSNEKQREFAKLYEKLCVRNNRFNVWQDFVWMVACAISNSVDMRYRDKREERYMQIISKYRPDEQEVFPELFALITMGMEEDPEQDFLGELYMQLNLGNDRQGQFFTPWSVCEMMSNLSIDAEKVKAHIDKYGYVSLSDPACGAGATLISAAMTLKAHGINYQRHALFTGQDIDSTTALMCYIQLTLLGCAGYVRIGSTLSDPMTGHVLFGDENENTWYTPMFFSDIWSGRRMVHNMRCAIRHLDGSVNGFAEEPSANMVKTEQAKEEPLQETREAPEPEEEPVIVVSGKKRNHGQLMFDFGG